MIKFDAYDSGAVIVSLAQALWQMIDAVENHYDPGSACYDERDLLKAVDEYLKREGYGEVAR